MVTPLPHAVAPAEIIGRGDKIIAAAYEQLSESGLDGLTIEAVLKRAGLNRRSFYERFTGKDDLVLAVFERALQSVADDYRGAAGRLRDPMEALRFMVRYLILAEGDVSEGKLGAALYREHMRLAAARPDDLHRALRPLIAVLSEQLAAGMACGQIRKSEPQRLANFVYNLVSTTSYARILSQEASEPAETDRSQLAEEVWAFCRRAIIPDSL